MPKKPCPICDKPADKARAPFCSVRCQQVDLNRWLTGHYVIPADEESDSVNLEDQPPTIN